jgi:hypothetical protein
MPLASIPVMSNPLDSLKHQRDYDGKGGDHDVKRKGFAADTTQHTHITNPGEATNQRKKHQRHDQHFQRVDEHLADHAKEAADDVVIDERDIHQVENNAYNDAKADGQRIFIVNDILPSPGCLEV